MKKYKISQITELREETAKEQNRNEQLSTLIDLMKQFPTGYSIIYGDEGVSIADPEHHVIVKNEPTVLLALKHALHRFRFMGLIARAIVLIK